MVKKVLTKNLPAPPAQAEKDSGQPEKRRPTKNTRKQVNPRPQSARRTYDYDFAVIGTGPAGEGASMMASKSKQSVLAIERFNDVGGGCTHWGTIPSKSVRQSIIAYLNLSKIPYLGKEINIPIPAFNDFLNMASSVINSQVKMRRDFYHRNNVPITYAQASFLDDHTLQLQHIDGKQTRITAKNIVIATGSRPIHPPGLDFSHPLILDSDKVLTLKHTPQSIVIYGAGVIGCEYASIFKNLGIKVDLVNSREHVLDFLDTEISDALNYHMRTQGIVIRNNETFASVDTHSDNIVLNLTSGKRIKANCLLWTQGRRPNVTSLNLPAAGIKVNERRIVLVNDHYQTNVKNIFAAGDVIGWPSLAGVAYDQGRSLVATKLGVKGYNFSPHYIPTGIYTTPEISFIGQTEKELTAQKLPYEVGVANFKNLAKAQILGDNVGILKILFHRETLELLGVHCFGRLASEIIHIGQAIMSQPGENNTLTYFLSNTFNYPSMAEAYRLAALNGYNRL